MAEILDIHMPEWLQASIAESLQDCLDYQLHRSTEVFYPTAVLKGAGENALDWLRSTTPEGEGYCNFWLDVMVCGTTNQDTHRDDFIKRICSVSNRPELSSGTIVLPDADEILVGYYSSDLFELRPSEGLTRSDMLIMLLQGQKQEIIQPLNGQVMEFNAKTELHCAPPLPPDTIRLFMGAEGKA